MENNYISDKENLQKVKDYISNGDFVNAQYVLDAFDIRDAEWHYLQSVVFYKKSWYNESKKQLEIAISMDPEEKKYQEELENLNKYLNSDNKQFKNSEYNQGGQTEQEQPQMGGNACLNSCCECLICNSILNCCCNCGRC